MSNHLISFNGEIAESVGCGPKKFVIHWYLVPPAHNEGNTISHPFRCEFANLGGRKHLGPSQKSCPSATCPTSINGHRKNQELLDQQSTKQHWTRRTSERMVLPPYLISEVLRISRYFKRTTSKCNMERSIWSMIHHDPLNQIARFLAQSQQVHIFTHWITLTWTYKISARVALLCHCRLHCWCNVRSLAQRTASYASLEAHLQHGT